MNTKAIFAVIIGLAALVALLAVGYRWTRSQEREVPPQAYPPASDPVTESATPEAAPSDNRILPQPGPTAFSESVPAPALVTNKLQRLNDTRETFRRLAAGDATVAIRAAKQLTDDTERETALLTLAAEWTRGELAPALQRARAIAAFGLEAGLGMELAKNPGLALLWANELTDGPGRAALLQHTAAVMGASDPSGALALTEQLPPTDRRTFSDALFSSWAGNDTDAALETANRLADPAERDAALEAVRSAAPVGIGAELRVQDGDHIINRLVPGTPAELSGQLHPGDRIVALAQGNGSFVEARDLSLAEVVQMIRGTPGTVVQLQVLSADAPPNTLPRTVSIVRDQIKFKR
jgi:hypothetical protein